MHPMMGALEIEHGQRKQLGKTYFGNFFVQLTRHDHELHRTLTCTLYTPL